MIRRFISPGVPGLLLLLTRCCVSGGRVVGQGVVPRARVAIRRVDEDLVPQSGKDLRIQRSLLILIGAGSRNEPLATEGPRSHPAMGL
jgi:hypothetical protein